MIKRIVRIMILSSSVCLMYGAAHQAEQTWVEQLWDAYCYNNEFRRWATGELIEIIQEGPASDVERLLNCGMNPNMKIFQNDDTVPILYLATCRGNEEACRLLLQRKADVHLPTDNGHTALQGAAWNVHWLNEAKKREEKEEEKGEGNSIWWRYKGEKLYASGVSMCKLLVREYGANPVLGTYKSSRDVLMDSGLPELASELDELFKLYQKQVKQGAAQRRIRSHAEVPVGPLSDGGGVSLAPVAPKKEKRKKRSCILQ